MLPLSCALKRSYTWPTLLFCPPAPSIIVSNFNYSNYNAAFNATNFPPPTPCADLLLCQVVNTVSALGH